MIRHRFWTLTVALNLLLIFLLYDFRVWLPYLEYRLNKTYIAENLCINKDKPEMHCHGKCYLKKQIKKAAEQETKLPATLGHIKMNDFFLGFQYWELSDFEEDVKPVRMFYVNFYKFTFLPNIFIPPQR